VVCKWKDEMIDFCARNEVDRLFGQSGGNKIVTATRPHIAGVQMNKDPDATANSKPGSRRIQRAGADAPAKKPGAKINRVYRKFLQDSVTQGSSTHQQLTAISPVKHLRDSARTQLSSRMSNRNPESVVARIDSNSIKILATGKLAFGRAAKVGEHNLNAEERHNLTAYKRYRDRIISQVPSHDGDGWLAKIDQQIAERFQKETKHLPIKATTAAETNRGTHDHSAAITQEAHAEQVEHCASVNKGTSRSTNRSAKIVATGELVEPGTAAIHRVTERFGAPLSTTDNSKNATNFHKSPTPDPAITPRPGHKVGPASDPQDALIPGGQNQSPVTDVSLRWSSAGAKSRLGETFCSGVQIIHSNAAIDQTACYRAYPRITPVASEGIVSQDYSRSQISIPLDESSRALVTVKRQLADDTRDRSPFGMLMAMPNKLPLGNLTTDNVPLSAVSITGKLTSVSDGASSTDPAKDGIPGIDRHSNSSRIETAVDETEGQSVNFRIVNGKMPEQEYILGIETALATIANSAERASVRTQADSNLQVAGNERPSDRARTEIREDQARYDRIATTRATAHHDESTQTIGRTRQNDDVQLDNRAHHNDIARADDKVQRIYTNETVRPNEIVHVDEKASATNSSRERRELNQSESMTRHPSALAQGKGYRFIDVGRAGLSTTQQYVVNRSLGPHIDGFAVSTDLITQVRSPQRRYILGAEIALAVLIASGGIASVKPDRQAKSDPMGETDLEPDEHNRPDVQMAQLKSESQSESQSDSESEHDLRSAKPTLRQNQSNDPTADGVDCRKNEHDEEVTDPQSAPASTFNPAPVFLRPTIMVGANDTLVSIAEHYFHDANLGWLIADLNRPNTKESIVDDQRIVELRTRQKLILPVLLDIEEFYRQPNSTHRQNLITIVEESHLDRELISAILGPVMSSDTKQIATKNAHSGMSKTTPDQESETPPEPDTA
jgi:hypothetical protein